MKTLVSMVERANSTTCFDVELDTVLAGIRDGRWKTEVEGVRAAYQTGGKVAAAPLKLRLHGFIPSGTFSRRAAAALVTHSGLLVADLDNLDKLPGDGLSRVRDALRKSPHLLALFLSPTGTGLKALFRVPADSARHRESFTAIARHVHDLAGVKIDPSGSDLCRLCFVSHDPNLHRNPDVVVMPVVESEPEPALYRETEILRRLSDGVIEDILSTSESFPNRLGEVEAVAAIEKFSQELLPTAKHQTFVLLFRLARLGKSIEKGRGRGLDDDELNVLFSAWHDAASSGSPGFVWRPRSEYRMEFVGVYPSAKFALDENPLGEGWKLANTEPLPPEAGQFADSPLLQKLVALCFQLAKLNCEGPGVFFLSCHSAGLLLRCSHTHANAMLNGLAGRGSILELVSKGSITGLAKQGERANGRASRYRWKGENKPK